nr:hypothetical protein GCM10020063_042110 [Dactylosporangium thailandense]
MNSVDTRQYTLTLAYGHAEPRGLLLAYTYEGRIGSPDLGLLMRVQHTGHQVLTQPVFMTGEWAQGLWDLVLPLLDFGEL